MIGYVSGAETVTAGPGQELSCAAGSPAITQLWLTPGSEWVLARGELLAAPPGLRAHARQRARDLAAAYGPGPGTADPAGFAIVRMPAVDPLLGVAVLHHSVSSGTVLYCPEKQLTEWAHPFLEVWLAAAVDHEVTAQVRRALKDFGLPGEYPVVIADVMIRSWIGGYHAAAAAEAGAEAAAAAEAKADRDFDVLVDCIADAARRHGAEVAMAAGEAPAEVLLYLLARGLSAADQRELLAQARQFVHGQGQPEAVGDPPGDGAAGSLSMVLMDHEQMPQGLLHFVVGVARAHAVTAWVCEEHLTAELAQWVGALCSAQASCLREA